LFFCGLLHAITPFVIELLEKFKVVTVFDLIIYAIIGKWKSFFKKTIFIEKKFVTKKFFILELILSFWL